MSWTRGNYLHLARPFRSTPLAFTPHLYWLHLSQSTSHWFKLQVNLLLFTDVPCPSASLTSRSWKAQKSKWGQMTFKFWICTDWYQKKDPWRNDAEVNQMNDTPQGRQTNDYSGAWSDPLLLTFDLIVLAETKKNKKNQDRLKPVKLPNQPRVTVQLVPCLMRVGFVTLNSKILASYGAFWMTRHWSGQSLSKTRSLSHI